MIQEFIKIKVSIVSGFLVFRAIVIFPSFEGSANAQILRQSSQKNQLS
jgi:hypothetical protein